MMRINADASNGAIRRLSPKHAKNGKTDNGVLSFCSAVYDRRTGRVLEMLQSVDSKHSPSPDVGGIFGVRWEAQRHTALLAS